MKRFVRSGVQLLVTAVFAAVGGFVAVSISDDAVDADPGRMSALVPMMTQADLATQDVAVSSTDLATTTITPVRIIDTRGPGAALGGTAVPWGALETRTVDAAGLGPIPEDAVGVVVNVTALNATEQGTFLTLFPTGSEMPNASTLNPTPGEIAYNAATVLLGPDGTFEVYNYSGTVDVIIDVTAYMTRTLADSVDTVETDVDEVEEEVDVVTDDVGRLRTGELLSPLRGVAGNGAMMFPDSQYQDWRSYSLSDEDGVFGAPIEVGRFSDQASVELRFALRGSFDNSGQLCLRIQASSGGIDDSEMCLDGTSGITSSEYSFFTTARVPLPDSGTLNPYVKVVGDPATCAGGYAAASCVPNLYWFGFYVFD